MAWPMIAAAALTGLKMLQDADKEKRSTKLAAATQRYAPWTGLQAESPFQANQAGNIAQGLGSYIGMEQGLEDRDLRKQWVEAQIEAMGGGKMTPQGASALAFEPADSGIPLAGKDYWNNQLNAPRAYTPEEVVNPGMQPGMAAYNRGFSPFAEDENAYSMLRRKGVR